MHAAGPEGAVREGDPRRDQGVHGRLRSVRGAARRRGRGRHRAREPGGVRRQGARLPRVARQRDRMSELRLTARQTADFELLANGGLAPLDGFQGHAAWETVTESMRLPDGRPWPIPVTLPSATGEVGETLTLIGHEGTRLGTLVVEEVYERDLQREAQQVYRTTDDSHPGVAALYREGSRTPARPIQADA